MLLILDMNVLYTDAVLLLLYSCFVSLRSIVWLYKRQSERKIVLLSQLCCLERGLPGLWWAKGGLTKALDMWLRDASAARLTPDLPSGFSTTELLVLITRSFPSALFLLEEKLNSHWLRAVVHSLSGTRDRSSYENLRPEHPRWS